MSSLTSTESAFRTSTKGFSPIPFEVNPDTLHKIIIVLSVLGPWPVAKYWHGIKALARKIPESERERGDHVGWGWLNSPCHSAQSTSRRSQTLPFCPSFPGTCTHLTEVEGHDAVVIVQKDVNGV